MPWLLGSDIWKFFIAARSSRSGSNLKLAQFSESKPLDTKPQMVSCTAKMRFMFYKKFFLPFTTSCQKEKKSPPKLYNPSAINTWVMLWHTNLVLCALACFESKKYTFRPN